MRWTARASLVIAAGIGTATPSPAAPAATSYWLAGNPHVPLAVVRGRAVSAAVGPSERGRSCGDGARWAARGSRWRAVDAWGNVVGTQPIRASEHYDVTGCREVTFASSPQDGTLLFVSEDSAWTPPRSAEWLPSAGDRTAVDRLLAAIGVGQPQAQLPKTLTEVRAEVRFFEIRDGSGATTRMAVGGRCGGWSVATLTRGAWAVTSQARAGTPAQRVCYRPLAVFDMNGDGTPEIVLRFIEGDGEWWGEDVIQRSVTGAWTTVARSPGGSTA